jgi:hypothetical protein
MIPAKMYTHILVYGSLTTPVAPFVIRSSYTGGTDYKNAESDIQCLLAVYQQAKDTSMFIDRELKGIRSVEDWRSLAKPVPYVRSKTDNNTIVRNFASTQLTHTGHSLDQEHTNDTSGDLIIATNIPEPYVDKILIMLNFSGCDYIPPQIKDYFLHDSIYELDITQRQREAFLTNKM